MEGADESTELRRHLSYKKFYSKFLKQVKFKLIALGRLLLVVVLVALRENADPQFW